MRRHLGPIARSRALRSLRRAEGCPAANALATALRSTGGAGDTSGWETRIEARRADLLASDAMIETPLGEYTGDPRDERVERRAVAEICRTDSKPRPACRLLLAVARELRPRAAIELGSALGISTAYQAAGLDAAGTGRLISIEASGARAEIAGETLESLSLSGRAQVRHGRFVDELPQAVAEIAPVEYAFVDGHHEEAATIAYWQMLKPHLGAKATVLFDDIRWSDGMARAWAAIAADPGVTLALDLEGIGACVLCSD